MKKIKGINLGGWLVLEKWMTPELYEGSKAEDEYHLLEAWGDSKAENLKQHRDTFITKDDFKWIASVGIDTVRLPVGHWSFEATGPYIECTSYIDDTFKWAEEYGLQVVLDVHAAPGCQNAFDNGGLSGVCEWHTDPINIDRTIDFIEALCVRYHNNPVLSGIQVLNEPRWDIPMEIIHDFYVRSYNKIREIVKDDVYIVFHDAFRLEEWKDFFTSHDFTNVILDTHMYQVFSYHDQQRNIPQLIEKVSQKRLIELQEVSEYVDVVVGEWSLGIHPNTLNQASTSVMKEALYRAVGNSLLLTFENVRGWFFWSYKLSEESTQKHPGWSFKDVILKGYLPSNMKE